MTLLEAIQNRHSVRRYKNLPLAEDVVKALEEKIAEVNSLGDLHVQLILNEPKGFNGLINYGTFSGISNYLVVAGRKTDDLDERAGYYGEQIVLLAQQLGLNTCWAGVSYRKVPGTYTLNEGEKIVCYIALGYGETQGPQHRMKSAKDISNASDLTPLWFRNGVEAALLAPTAVNQMKYYFEYLGRKEGKYIVKASKGHSLIGYTSLDLGIGKLHFEIGAGKERFEWQ